MQEAQVGKIKAGVHIDPMVTQGHPHLLPLYCHHIPISYREGAFHSSF